MRSLSRIAQVAALAGLASALAACGGHGTGALPATSSGPNAMGGDASAMAAKSTPTPAPAASPFTEYPLTAGSQPNDIVSAGGELWFTEGNGCGVLSAVGSITTTGSISENSSVIGPCSDPYGMVVASDGIWFTEYFGARIARITTGGTAASGSIYEAPVLPDGTADATIPNPSGITKDALGNFWFAEFHSSSQASSTTAGKIGESATATGTLLNEYAGSNGPYDIVYGLDKNIWYTEAVAGGGIGKISTVDGHLINHYMPVTANAAPMNIIVGPDKNIWFTECNGSGTDSVARITVSSGAVTEFPLPGVSPCPNGLTIGADGNLWIAETGANAIARMTLTGTVTEYAVPTANAAPFFITQGPDGNLWFTENGAGQIGKFNPNTATSSGSGGGSGSGSGCDRDNKHRDKPDVLKNKEKDKDQDNKPCCKSKPNDKDKGRDGDKGCAD